MEWFATLILACGMVSAILAFLVSWSFANMPTQSLAFTSLIVVLIIDFDLWLLGLVGDVTDQPSHLLLLGLVMTTTVSVVYAWVGRRLSRYGDMR